MGFWDLQINVFCFHSRFTQWKQGPWFVIDMSTKHLSGKWPAFV